MKLVELIECEVVHDKMKERVNCYINPACVAYIEDHDEFTGYSFIGLVGGTTTIVKGTAKEINEKLKGKRWLKTTLLQ